MDSQVGQAHHQSPTETLTICYWSPRRFEHSGCLWLRTRSVFTQKYPWKKSRLGAMKPPSLMRITKNLAIFILRLANFSFSVSDDKRSHLPFVSSREAEPPSVAALVPIMRRPTSLHASSTPSSEASPSPSRPVRGQQRLHLAVAAIVLISLSATLLAISNLAPQKAGSVMLAVTRGLVGEPWLPPATFFPKDVKLHNEQFVTRGRDFDYSVSREKGIVMCIHNAMVPMGLSLIKELRCHGNNELVQIYHCFNEITVENQLHIGRQDARVEVVDVCADLLDAGVFADETDVKKFQNWWSKPLAVYHTNLKELIVLDADDILMHDPDIVRKTSGYKANGTMFFYDRVLEPRGILSRVRKEHGNMPVLHYIVENFDYEAFGLTGPKPSQQLLNSLAYQGQTGHEMDSSLVAIDKSRAGKAMDVLWWMITQLRVKHPEFTLGDKETFWLSFELAHVPYAFSPWGVSVVNSWPNRDMIDHPDTLCGSIAQYIPVENPDEATLFYVNGDALLDPITQGADSHDANRNIYFNMNVTHIVPRSGRKPRPEAKVPAECLVGFGSERLPAKFQHVLFRRRVYYAAIASGIWEPLNYCTFVWDQEL